MGRTNNKPCAARKMRRAPSACVAFAAALAIPTVSTPANEKPEILSVNEVYTWTSADRALTVTGEVRPDLPAFLREGLERQSASFSQSFVSAAQHGL